MVVRVVAPSLRSPPGSCRSALRALNFSGKPITELRTAILAHGFHMVRSAAMRLHVTAEEAGCAQRLEKHSGSFEAQRPRSLPCRMQLAPLQQGHPDTRAVRPAAWNRPSSTS